MLIEVKESQDWECVRGLRQPTIGQRPTAKLLENTRLSAMGEYNQQRGVLGWVKGIDSANLCVSWSGIIKVCKVLSYLGTKVGY
jgi:hypothetical protein